MARLLAVFLGLLALLVALSESFSSAASSCTTVDTQLEPCMSYVEHDDDLKIDGPSEACCKGVKDVYNQAKTKQDHIAICNCIKEAVIAVGDIIPSRIAEIPKKCGLSYNMPPIDKNFDCNTIP